MGVIRVEGSSKLYFRFKDGRGKWVRRPSPYSIGQEKLAEAAFRKAMEALEAGQEFTDVVSGEITIRSYGERWCDKRKAAGIVGARNERGHLELHLYELVGGVRLDAFKPQDRKPLIKKLEKRRRAPKSKAEKTGEVQVADTISTRHLRHVLETLRALFTSALEDGLVATNPIVLRRGLLPAKRDKKINRALHRFVVPEVEQLISDPRIPPERRVVYGILFLGGLRPEEVVRSPGATSSPGSRSMRW